MAPEGIGLVGSPSGFVAFGAAGGRAAIFTSPDGIEWTAVDAASAGLDAGAVSSISRTDSGFIAAGWRDDGSSFDGALWESADGIAWSAIRPAEPFVGPLDTLLVDAMQVDGRWWIYGRQGPHEDRVRCERMLGMVASMEAIPENPAEDPHFSCGWGLDTFWVSDDGRTWERLPVRALGEQAPRGELIEFRFVEAAEDGLLALGEGSGDSHPSVFRTLDGRAWERLASHPPFKPGQSIAGFALSNGSLVAVGEDWDPNGNAPPSPTVWIGVPN